MSRMQIDTKKLSEDFFEMHCEDLSKISEIYIDTRSYGEQKITNYDDLSKLFPQLSNDFKNSVIRKYKRDV